MPVGEMLQRMTSRELSEWIAFSRLEPFASRTKYIGSAIVAATIANVNLPKGKQPLKPEDFMPDFAPAEPQTVEQMIQFAHMMTIALGGEDRRNEET